MHIPFARATRGRRMGLAERKCAQRRHKKETTKVDDRSRHVVEHCNRVAANSIYRRLPAVRSFLHARRYWQFLQKKSILQK